VALWRFARYRLEALGRGVIPYLAAGTRSVWALHEGWGDAWSLPIQHSNRAKRFHPSSKYPFLSCNYSWIM